MFGPLSAGSEWVWNAGWACGCCLGTTKEDRSKETSSVNVEKEVGGLFSEYYRRTWNE